MPETPERNVGFLFHDVSRLMHNAFDERVRELGLTRSRWRVLVHLLRQNRMTQSELAEELDVGKASLGALLDGLEERGWIERKGDARDRRAKRVHLTEKVAPVLTFMNGVGAQLHHDSLAGLTTTERQQLVEMLIHIKSNLLVLDAAAPIVSVEDRVIDAR